MKKVELTVPHITPSWNTIYSNGHWTKRKTLVDFERERIGWELKALNPPSFEEKVNIKIHQFKTGRQDSDNITAKLWIDAMCDVGILKDDSQEYVGWVCVRCDPSEGSKSQRTVVTIEKDV